MSKQCVIYVVRHGQSILNRDNIISGHATNPSLTEKGRQQARTTKDKLAGVKFDEAYSSDLERAIETGEIIFGKPIPKDHQITDLRERYFGQIDGKPEKHLDGLHEELMALSSEERWFYSHAEDMEHDHSLVLRFTKGVMAIAQDNPGKTILVAAHGGSIRVMLIKLGYGTHKEVKPRSFKNGGYVKLAYDGKNLKVLDVVGLSM